MSELKLGARPAKRGKSSAPAVELGAHAGCGYAE
jgi:hypothetical protein